MFIKVEKILTKELVDLACSYTADKEVIIKDMESFYRSEHSPIRTQLFLVRMDGIPTYASVHFTRHHIGIEHFVKSNRNTDEIITRDTPVNHLMFLNAQSLINISRKRLCAKADKLVVDIMYKIREKVNDVDPELARNMLPECKYRGFCPEMKSCKKVS